MSLLLEAADSSSGISACHSQPPGGAVCYDLEVQPALKVLLGTRRTHSGAPSLFFSPDTLMSPLGSYSSMFLSQAPTKVYRHPETVWINQKQALFFFQIPNPCPASGWKVHQTLQQTPGVGWGSNNFVRGRKNTKTFPESCWALGSMETNAATEGLPAGVLDASPAGATSCSRHVHICRCSSNLLSRHSGPEA